MITFVGIDQTGATTPGKPHLPRRLPCAWVDASSKTLHLAPRGLQELSPDAIFTLTGEPKRMIVLLDCVIGLPNALGPTAFEGALTSLRNLELKNPRAPFGRKAAESFFKELLKTHGFSAKKALPTRKCEVLAGANSVFKARPFQKNIQTGTYRLWREIARYRAALLIWPFDSSPTSPASTPSLEILEGYPSLLWKKVFGFSSRNPKHLAEAFRKKGLHLNRTTEKAIARDPNLADAAVLAAGGLLLHQKKALGASSFSQLSSDAQSHALLEGWIAGLFE